MPKTPMRIKKYILLFCSAVIGFYFLAVPIANSAQVTLAWDPNSETTLAGYKVHYGTASRSYQAHQDAGLNTTYTVSNLQDGVTYYFTVTAYDSSGNESGYSAEVSYTGSSTCTYTISPVSQNVSSSGSAGAVSIATPSGCTWTAVSNASWILVTSNSSGAGNGTVNYSVTANATSAARTGTMTIAGKTFTVNESGISCSYAISPTSQSFNSDGGTGAVSVTAASGCTWNASASASWISINSGSSGNGNGNVNFTVAANSSSSSRTGTLNVSGRIFTVTQTGLPQYTLSVSKNGTGTGSVTNTPVGSSFNSGTVVSLTAAPDPSSTFGGWSGSCSGSSPTCILTATGNISATATFNLKTQTITAITPLNGSILPAGTVTVNYGASQTFSIQPNPGYQVADVKVDGNSIGAASTYTFANVTVNHTIQASFVTAGSYSLSLMKEGTGTGTVSADPAGPAYSAGTAVTLTAIPDANSNFSGWSGGCSGTTPTCIVTMDANKSVAANFSRKSYTITAVAGTNGSITPAGSVTVNYGNSRSFTITPARGYRISDVKVDGVSVGTPSSFLFGNVRADHKIEAVFTRKFHRR